MLNLHLLILVLNFALIVFIVLIMQLNYCYLLIFLNNLAEKLKKIEAT